VVDLRVLLGHPRERSSVSRFVSLRVEQRRIALAVDEVLGLQELADSDREALAPLLEAGNPVVEALASLDQALVLLLRSARLMPPEGLETR
jgi:purine-binding chemotaxis protein CheW